MMKGVCFFVLSSKIILNSSPGGDSRNSPKSLSSSALTINLWSPSYRRGVLIMTEHSVASTLHFWKTKSRSSSTFLELGFLLVGLPHSCAQSQNISRNVSWSLLNLSDFNFLPSRSFWNALSSFLNITSWWWIAIAKAEGTKRLFNDSCGHDWASFSRYRLLKIQWCLISVIFL